MSYKKLAQLVASKLTKEELIDLAEKLDKDSGDDFCHFIQAETFKVAPEIYGDYEGDSKEDIEC